MIISILILLIGFLVSISIGQVISIAVRTVRLRQRHRKHSTMPQAPGFSIFGGHALSYLGHKRVHLITEEYHKKLGKSFAYIFFNNIGVATIDLDLIKTIVIDNGAENINRCDSLYLPIDELEYDSPIIAKDSQWRRLRRCTAPAFSSHKIKALNVSEDVKFVIKRLTDSLESRIDEASFKTGKPEAIIDVEDIAHRYAIDIVFTCFYKQKYLVDYLSKTDYYTSIVEAGLKTLASIPAMISAFFPMFRGIIQFLITHFHPQGKLRVDIMSFIKEQTRNNFEEKKRSSQLDTYPREESVYKSNMIDYITDEFYHGRLTQREYFHSTFFMFLAADKTSADAISKLIYNLACHQEVQEKLRQSIKEHGTDSEYLSWCINESLRLFPPTLVGCSRSVSKDIDTECGRILAGSYVLTCAYSIHRLPEYWGPDANEYKPGRWAHSQNFHPLQFLPFGFGLRGCPGRDFAIFEIKLLMTTLIEKFRFTIDSNQSKKLDFQAPLMMFTIFDLPTYIRVSRN